MHRLVSTTSRRILSTRRVPIAIRGPPVQHRAISHSIFCPPRPTTTRFVVVPKSTNTRHRKLSTYLETNPLLYMTRYLDFVTYSDDELDAIFHQIARNNSNNNKGCFEPADLERYLDARLPPSNDPRREAFLTSESAKLFALLAGNSSHTVITRDRFVSRVLEFANTVDLRRTLPILTSIFLVGASVGVVTPAMPFVVQSLQLSTSQYGAIVSAFGLAKLLGNVPAAVGVELHGRKPYMVYSLVMLSMGVGGIGLCGSFESLFMCRLLTGLGVAGLSTAGTLMVTDLSTNLNRARTLAPVMSAFSAGACLGPAVGGYLVDNVGLNVTFYMVGLSYLGVSVLNRLSLTETKRRPQTFPWEDAASQTRNSREGQQTITGALTEAVGQWKPLLKDDSVRNVMILNGLYWTALSGSQMTVLPLWLTQDLGWTATQVGSVYMGMSMIQIVGNPIFGSISDKIGRVPMMTAATTLMGTSMLILPSFDSLLVPLTMWSMGSSMLSTAPIAHISDRVDASQRAQAIALLRTSGDVGLLFGATGFGALADVMGSLPLTLQSTAGIMLSTSAWFAARNYLDGRIAAKKV